MVSNPQLVRQQTTEDIQSQLQEAKRTINKMKDKNSKLLARIGYLTKEVADRDKLMQKFVLNGESEVKVKESCVLQQYKSKLQQVEKKNEALSKKKIALKAEQAKFQA